MRAQVCRGGLGQFAKYTRVRAWSGVRVCRLMDSARVWRGDWLQCDDVDVGRLCVPAREYRPRNIISADWHFAFATINIAPRNFEFYRDDLARFPRTAMSCTRFRPIPICGTKFTASCDNIIESCVKEARRYRAWIIEIAGIVQIDTIVSIRVSIFSMDGR